MWFSNFKGCGLCPQTYFEKLAPMESGTVRMDDEDQSGQVGSFNGNSHPLVQ